MNRSTGIWRKDWFWALGIVLLVLIVHKTTGLTEGLERRFYDETSTQIARKPASNVAIIAIDDSSIANMGRWPWPRGCRLHRCTISLPSE